MRIELNILNNVVSEKNDDNDKMMATWHSRRKVYETDNMVSMDEDIKNSTVGHKLDRLILTDIQITSKSGISDLIEFLEKAKASFSR